MALRHSVLDRVCLGFELFAGLGRECIHRYKQGSLLLYIASSYNLALAKMRSLGHLHSWCLQAIRISR